MFIHEAIKEATERKAHIRRKWWGKCGVELWTIEPITIYHKSNCPSRWNPTVDDLMADDWEVVE
jgi:hypothetical protein